MKFHVEFSYTTGHRAELIRTLAQGGLQSDSEVKVVGAWVAVETGFGYAILESDNAKALYEMCSRWSDYGDLQVTPIVSAKEI